MYAWPLEVLDVLNDPDRSYREDTEVNVRETPVAKVYV